jgi:ketosteroid isomerase-like protein
MSKDSRSDDVAETMRAMYAAAAIDDEARLKEIFADDFYAFDLGKRFDGMALAQLIKAAHAAGRTFVWTVKDPETHMHGDLAWITYVNRGSVGDAAGVTPVTWLESAVLRHDGRRWRIRFFHSTRVPAEQG